MQSSSSYSFLLPLPKEGGYSSLLGFPIWSNDSSLDPISNELCWGQSSGCRVWKSALCSAACQSLGQTWCQDEDHKHLPRVPAVPLQQCSLQSSMGFSPIPSLPLPWHIFLCTETTGVSKLSLLFLGRQVWEGPPARFEHKVAFEHLSWYTVVGFFSCSGLGALPRLPQGSIQREIHTAAGAACLGSTARVMDLNSTAGNVRDLGGTGWGASATCRAGAAAVHSHHPCVPDTVRSFSKDTLQRDGKSWQEFHGNAKAKWTWAVQSSMG